MKAKIINSTSLEQLKSQINNEIQDFHRWTTQIQTEISDTQKRDQNQERITDFKHRSDIYQVRIEVCRSILVQIDELTTEIEI